jgi:hypothetical protein
MTGRASRRVGKAVGFDRVVHMGLVVWKILSTLTSIEHFSYLGSRGSCRPSICFIVSTYRVIADEMTYAGK